MQNILIKPQPIEKHRKEENQKREWHLIHQRHKQVQQVEKLKRCENKGNTWTRESIKDSECNVQLQKREII